ncbi:helix-turn-helix transcriptional regulator [Streptococcus equinus]|uniref:helix-turn-helix transcriptional regulator n=1 Tax=Streptococcus equinus TaxID=1335 RepID=UPI00237A92E5|nr:helix-turn-helix transcriptional regulator [Streptococcus equinus]
MKELKPNITVREIRARENMNQEDFGKMLGVSAQTVGSWEKDVYSISSKNLVKLCLTYHVTSFDLLGA